MGDQRVRPRGRRAQSAEDLRFYQALGRAIKAVRAQQGLDRKSLAGLAEVSYPYLSEIENGKKRPSARALLAIAQALGVRLYELLESTEAIARSMDPEGIHVGAAQPIRGDRAAAGTYAQLVDAPSVATLAAEPMTPPSRRASWLRRTRLPARESSDVVPPFEPVGVFTEDRAQTVPPARSGLMSELFDLAGRLSDEDLGRLIDLAHRLSG